MDGPVILNGVQHVFQPPQQMPGVTVDRSRLLFITADLDRAAVETSLRDDLPRFLRLSRERAERAARAAADPSIPFQPSRISGARRSPPRRSTTDVRYIYI